MSAPVFKLALIYPDGTSLPITAGGPVEIDLKAACKAAILSKGVGMFRTEAQVAQAIDEGITETIQALKDRARQYV